jgi:ABC-type polysaccharide/polyol phosphate transport system ATPase subunit
MDAIIEVEKLEKSFFIPRARRETVREHAFNLFRSASVEELKVLAGIDFSIKRGETFCIMGRNGCGKSTLLKILSQIYAPDRGRVTVKAPITTILELGVGWSPELTAEDNIFLTGTAMGLSLKELKASLAEILAFAELERFANLQLKFYSSGMSARLAYAIAFKAVREILILDEIFAVGDVGFQNRCKARYRELRRAGHTVVMVAHDADIVRDFCDRGILLEGGRVKVAGDAHTIAAAYDQLGDIAEPRAAGD